ncbi:c-type cytochrome [Parapedobacter sp. DT-150]|uniref:c-type cytochrome n=1 Tax=Parapedobacter sp. DT-150 TaxID=3396162 RepID=UPI003F1BD17E
MRVNSRPGIHIRLFAATFLSALAVACGGQQTEEQTKVEMETAAEPPVELSPGMKAGKVVYDQYCATCHQQNGSGVPNLNPPLTKTDYVTGDKERLIRIVLNGSNEGLEVNGMVYSNAMPAHVFLKDEEVAQVLSYIRNSFGNRADTLTAEEVAQIRDTLK